MKNRRPVVIRRMSTTLFWWFLTTLMVAGPGLAQWWGPKTFDGVIGTLVQELIGQVDLKTQPVVVQSYGFFDSDTGLSLPLSGVLKDRVITALRRQGVRVFLQEADPSASWWLHGTWRKLGNEVLLDFRLVG